MKPKVRIDHTVCRGRGHAHSSHVVIAVVAAGEEVCAPGEKVLVGMDARYTGQRLCRYLNVLPDGGKLTFGDLPIEARAQQAETIAAFRQRNAASRGRLLLTVDAEEDARVRRIVGTLLKFVAKRLPGNQRKVASGKPQVCRANLAHTPTQEILGSRLQLSESRIRVAHEGHCGGNIQSSVIQRPMRNLFSSGKAQFRMVLEASAEDIVEYLVKAPGVKRLDRGRVAVDMVLKVFSQQPGAVPRETACPWLQKEAGAFDSSEAEDKLVGAKDRLDTRERPAAEAAHRFAFQ